MVDRQDDTAPSEARQPAAALKGLTRRGVLAGAAGGLALAAPFVRRASAAERRIKIATYGGNFETGFKTYIYPEFQKATGIAVDSVPEPADLGFLMQLIEANRTNTAPLDLCVLSQLDVLRGDHAKLFRPLNAARIPNLKSMGERFLYRSGSELRGVGAMGWYMALIVNPETFPVAPKSWKILWEPGHASAWGAVSGGDSPLFEITAATWFGGIKILETKDGIRQVIAKIAELKPNVKVWWESEGTMQTAYENDEVVGGMYFYDVAGVMAKSGIAVTRIIPDEGGVMDFGRWCQPAASTKHDEAEEFINFMCAPENQALMARKTGTAPLVDRKLTNLTDAEFAAVSSDKPPIDIDLPTRLANLDFMDEQFTKMLAG